MQHCSRLPNATLNILRYVIPLPPPNRILGRSRKKSGIKNPPPNGMAFLPHTHTEKPTHSGCIKRAQPQQVGSAHKKATQPHKHLTKQFVLQFSKNLPVIWRPMVFLITRLGFQHRTCGKMPPCLLSALRV